MQVLRSSTLSLNSHQILRERPQGRYYILCRELKRDERSSSEVQAKQTLNLTILLYDVKISTLLKGIRPREKIAPYKRRKAICW